MLLILIQIVGCVLVTDFLSGLLHWLEDSYGSEDVPILGRLVTLENNLHHQRPALMTLNSWWESSKLLLAIATTVGVAAWALGLFGWQLMFVLVLGVNANQVHKWAHSSRRANGRFITWLHDKKILQSQRHHGRHHTGTQRTNYCVVTPHLNPILDGVGFWRGLEGAIAGVLRVSPRDPSVGPIA